LGKKLAPHPKTQMQFGPKIFRLIRGHSPKPPKKKGNFEVFSFCLKKKFWNRTPTGVGEETRVFFPPGLLEGGMANLAPLLPKGQPGQRILFHSSLFLVWGTGKKKQVCGDREFEKLGVGKKVPLFSKKKKKKKTGLFYNLSPKNLGENLNPKKIWININIFPPFWGIGRYGGPQLPMVNGLLTEKLKISKIFFTEGKLIINKPLFPLINPFFFLKNCSSIKGICQLNWET